MYDFEEVLYQYQPMISSLIRKLNIYRDHEQYRQVGMVALWQAWQRFDSDKGQFTPFAYRSIRGAMLDELKKHSRFEEHVTQMEDELLEKVIDSEISVEISWSDSMVEVLSSLKVVECELIGRLFVDGLTLAECAEAAGISVAGVKKRRERVLRKLRGLLVDVL